MNVLKMALQMFKRDFWHLSTGMKDVDDELDRLKKRGNISEKDCQNLTWKVAQNNFEQIKINDRKRELVTSK